MSQRRFLLVSQDAGGTVPPMIAVAQSLARRGHDVTVLGQPSIRGRAVGIGARFVPFTTVPDYETHQVIEEQLLLALAVIAGDGPANDVRAVADAEGSDAVVIDCNLAGAAAAAESLDRPSAILLHAMLKTRVDTWFAELWPLLADVINATRGSFGLGPVSSWTELFSMHERIYAPVPQMFDAPVEHSPANMRHFGFLVPEFAVRKREQYFPEGDGKSVLVGLSTTYQHQEHLLQTIVDALADVDVRGLVTTAGYHADLRAPSNVAIRAFVPHQLVIAETDAVVTHAGMATVAVALKYGVPLVCTPIARDQPLNASRVEALGAGLALGPEPAVEDIRNALVTVLENAEYRRSAETIASASAEEGGPSALADDLETLCRT